MRSGRSIPWIPISMGIAIGLLAAFAFFGPGLGQGEEDGSLTYSSALPWPSCSWARW